MRASRAIRGLPIVLDHDHMTLPSLENVRLGVGGISVRRYKDLLSEFKSSLHETLVVPVM